MKTHDLSHRQTGSALILALILVALLSFIAGNVLMTIVPRLKTTTQATSWQESMLCAEAGIDIGLGELTDKVEILMATDWGAAGWRKKVPRAQGSPGQLGEPATASMLKPKYKQDGSSLYLSETIVRDNVWVTPANGPRSQVDVQLTALYPDPGQDLDTPSGPIWFRIRAFGTTAIPDTAQTTGAEGEDSQLRRLNLRSMRASLAGDDNLAHEIPVPNATRMIEVIAKPIPRFPKALLSKGKMDIGESHGWTLNSYKKKKKDDGTTEEQTAAFGEGKADIASTGKNSDGTPMGEDETQIAMNADNNEQQVNGNVSTNGKTSSDTAPVTGAPPASSAWWDNYTIYTDYDRELRSPKIPAVSYSTSPTPDVFEAGPAGSPKAYAVNGTQGSFTINPPASSTSGEVIIVVNGDLDLRHGNKAFIEINGDVKAQVYVSGNIDLGNGEINTADKKNPLNLRIYGTGSSGEFRTEGNPGANALFYGPDYDVIMKGGGQGGSQGAWRGAMVANSISLVGGGNSDFLYPEELLNDSEMIGFEIVRYFEDSRK